MYIFNQVKFYFPEIESGEEEEKKGKKVDTSIRNFEEGKCKVSYEQFV